MYVNKKTVNSQNSPVNGKRDNGVILDRLMEISYNKTTDIGWKRGNRLEKNRVSPVPTCAVWRNDNGIPPAYSGISPSFAV